MKLLLYDNVTTLWQRTQKMYQSKVTQQIKHNEHKLFYMKRKLFFSIYQNFHSNPKNVRLYFF